MSVFKIRGVSYQWLRHLCQERVRYKAATPYWVRKTEDLSINKILEAPHLHTDVDWMNIREELCNSDIPVNDVNVDATILNTCCHEGQLDVALNYLKFLKKNNKFNIATSGKYLKIFYDLKRPITTEELREIEEVYDSIIAEHPVLDALTAERCMHGLSLTTRWKECINLLNMVELSSLARSVSYSIVAEAAFNHDNWSVGWEYIKKMELKLKPDSRVYKSYLNYCMRHSKTPAELEYLIAKLFAHWADANIYPDLEILYDFTNCLKDSGAWTVHPTTISPDGVCHCCKHSLSPLQLISSDFKYLQEKVMGEILVGKDIYQNTTPEELQRFQKFVQSVKPFDVAIDGLNVGYCNRVISKGKMIRGAALSTIVKSLVNQNKKVFVCGRQHMQRWPDMDYIRSKSSVFLAQDQTVDDPFLIYATIASGMNTYFITHDFLRQHKFLLSDSRIHNIFKQWQFTRQMTYQLSGHNKKSVILEYPPTYLPVGQKDSNGWHIPYKETLSGKEIQPTTRPKTWICIRKVNNV